MPFMFTACPGPIANVTYLRSGAVSAQYTTIADESLWLDDFTQWTRGAGAATIIDSLDPEGVLGVSWGEVVEDYAAEHGATLTDDDRDLLLSALGSGGMDDLEGTHLHRLAAVAVADLVIRHARAAFDTDMDETHVHAGEVVTGGPVALDEEDDIEQYPTSVFQSVEFLRDMPYFKYRAPFTVIHTDDPETPGK